jgi:hypothetical protein
VAFWPLQNASGYNFAHAAPWLPREDREWYIEVRENPHFTSTRGPKLARTVVNPEEGRNKQSRKEGEQGTARCTGVRNGYTKFPAISVAAGIFFSPWVCSP